MERIDKELKMQELISERCAWMVKNESCLDQGEEMHYTEEDFLDLAVGMRQLAGEEINME